MKIVYRVHAIRRMFERNVTAAEVGMVLADGETIENYPDDQPYPSRLVLGFVDEKPVHVVCAESLSDDQMIVITVYEPELERWSADFRIRRKS